MRCKNDAQRGAETASSRSHPPLAARAGRGWQGTRPGISLCSKQRLSHQWQRNTSGQTETVLGTNAGRQELWHPEGRLHISGASELALDVVRCCSITHRVPALSELLLRAPPRHATRWNTHEGFPVHYTRAGALLYNSHGQLGVLYNAHALEVSSVFLLPLSCCFGFRPETQRDGRHTRGMLYMTDALAHCCTICMVSWESCTISRAGGLLYNMHGPNRVEGTFATNV